MGHWRVSFQNPEELESVMPAYQDIGHPKRKDELGLRHKEPKEDVTSNPIPYLYVPELNKLVYGRDHSDIMRRLMNEYGMDAKQAFNTLFGNWSGRFDLDNDAISVQLLTTEDAEVEVPPDVIQLLQSEFHKLKDTPGFVPVIPYGKTGNPIIRNDKMHYYAKGKWTTKYAAALPPQSEEEAESDSAYTASQSFHIHDVDRYCSDDYAVNVALQERKSRYSIGIYITNQKVGVSSWQEYWHYARSEKEQAYSTYNQIITAIPKLIEEIEWNEVPMSLIMPMVRNTLDSIDNDHKERSGYPIYNIYRTDVPKAADWRALIYGPRYPHQYPETMNSVFAVVETEVAKVEKEDVGRRQTYKYRYAQQKTIDKAPQFHYYAHSKSGWTRIAANQGGSQMNISLPVFDWLGRHWKSLVPLQVFLAWYGAQGGTPQDLAERMKAGQSVPQIIEQVQQSPSETQPVPELFSVPESQPASEPQIPEEPQTTSESQPSPEEPQPDTFGDVLDMTLGFEGGYSNNPSDPGGETNRGITRRTYEQYLKQHGMPTTNINMRNIPDEHVRDIYKTMYWDRVGGDSIPPVVARQVFDFAVNSGTSRAVRYLQGIVGSKQDGKFGPKTQRAVLKYIAEHGQDALAQEYLNRRKAFVNNFVKKHPQFPGLLNRIEQMQQYIPTETKDLRMRSKNPPPALPPFETVQSKVFTGGEWNYQE